MKSPSWWQASALVLVFLVPAGVEGEELILDDPLTDADSPPKTVQGGSFSPAGWTRDNFESKIIYDLGREITHGRMQFEMDGVNGHDHGVGGWPDCRAIFAAVDSDGAGNLGNQNIWVWAMDSTQICNGADEPPWRTNRMKLLLRTLTDPEPGEPMSAELDWDESRFYTYEVTWDETGGVMKRDGVTVLENSFDTERLMHLRFVFLGTINRYRAGVGNATYRNLKVWDLGSTPGEPDAGVDAGHDAGHDAGSDTGGLPSMSLTPEADAHVITTEPDANFGTAEQMCVAREWYFSLVRFDITGVSGTVTDARLYLTTSNPGYCGTIHPLADNGWGETTVTYNTRPAWDEGTHIDEIAIVDSGQRVSYDLTGHVPASGLVSFAIANHVQGDGCCFKTREAAPAERPLLVITYDPDQVPDGDGGSGTDEDGPDAGDPGAGSDPGPADRNPGNDPGTGSDQGPDDPGEEGCGCGRISAARTASPQLIAAFMMALACAFCLRRR